MSNLMSFLNKYERNITFSGIVFFSFLAIATLLASLSCDCISREKTTLHEIHTVNLLKGNDNLKLLHLPEAVKVDSPFDVIVDLAPFQGEQKRSIVTSFAYCNVKVYGDEKLLYQLQKSDNRLTKSGAYQVVIFDIPDNLQNPAITMHIEPTLKSIEYYKVADIILGRKCDIIVNMIKNDSLTIIISVILLLNYFIMLLIVIKKKNFIMNENYRIFHLSILGSLVAVYFLTQLWTVNYFLAPFKEFIYFSEYMSLLLMLVPASLYISSKLDPKFNKFFKAIAIVLLLNTVTQFILTLLQIIEFKEMIYITHGFMYVSIIYIFIAITLTDGKKYPSKYTLLLPTVAIIISTVIPLIYYLFYRLLIFKALGLIITVSLIALETMEIYVKYTKYKTEKIERDIYKKMAITDSLTGLANRQAHEDYIEKIERDDIAGWILSIDLNSLKYINDKYGHVKGDKLIVDFATLLKQIKEENDKIHPFRIGGDEFFVFIESDNSFAIKSLVDQLKIAYNQCDGFEDNFVPSFSVGYHYYDPTMNDNVIGVYNIADKLMYDDKIRYKKRFRNRINIT